MFPCSTRAQIAATKCLVGEDTRLRDADLSAARRVLDPDSRARVMRPPRSSFDRRRFTQFVIRLRLVDSGRHLARSRAAVRLSPRARLISTVERTFLKELSKGHSLGACVTRGLALTASVAASVGS